MGLVPIDVVSARSQLELGGRGGTSEERGHQKRRGKRARAGKRDREASWSMSSWRRSWALRRETGAPPLGSVDLVTTLELMSTTEVTQEVSGIDVKCSAARSVKQKLLRERTTLLTENALSFGRNRRPKASGTTEDTSSTNHTPRHTVGIKFFV